MESSRMVTRSQRRMSIAVDENAAVQGRKDAGNQQQRPRRALNNISNRQPTDHASQWKSTTINELEKVKSVTDVLKESKSGELHNSKSEKLEKRAQIDVTAVQDVENQPKESVRPDRGTAGFTRTLIAKTERPSTNYLVQRTENLQLSGDDDVVIVSSPMPDIDSKDLHDHLECAEYASDIFTFFRRMEPSIQVDCEYMNQQRYITRQMRAVLIDWIVDVHAKFKLIPESLFLAIWILDRFLSKQEVERRNLQLAGIASLVIANKYEEVYGPQLRDYETICAGAYTRADILKMERAILKTLDFGLTVPTAFTFLARYIKASNYGSMVAAAAIYASFKAFSIEEEDDDWPRVLRKHTGYTVEEIKPCAAYLVNLMDKATSTQYRALFHKFKKKEYSGVARYKAPTTFFGVISQHANTASNNV